MRKTLIGLAGLVSAFLPNSGFAQEYKVANVFSGSEVRLYVMSNVNNDCTSGPRPEVRVVTQPTNGTARLEEKAMPLNRAASDPNAKCNGKNVDAVILLYTSNPGYTGLDKLVIETDFYHTGNVRRYEAVVDVR
jgi:hypothetical protein